MNLSITISYVSNLLSFVYRTNKANLIKFDLQKYFINENIDIFFYGNSEDKIWNQIEKSIGKQEVKQFRESIIPLKTIFDSRWDKTSRHLSLWRQYFQDNISLLQQAISDIKKINGVEHFVFSEIPIYLVSDFKSKDKEIGAWFSWTSKETFMVIEIPFNFQPNDSFFPLSILVHEFFHLILRKNEKLFSYLKKKTEENNKLLSSVTDGMPNRLFLEELLISSFLPEGYLGEKYFHIKNTVDSIKPEGLLEWRRFVAYRIKQKAKEYIDNNRQVDSEYLEGLIGIIKQNKK